MEHIRGYTLIHNGQPVETESYQNPPSTGLYYEVIRLNKGRFMFLEDHIDRLINSCSHGHADCPDTSQIKTSLNTLLEHEPFEEGNIKIIVYNVEGVIHLDCFFIPHRYPTEDEYSRGVALKTFRYTRPNPTIKRWNESFREQVNTFIARENIYEAILVNDAGVLTEGSRSNLFFIHPEGDVVTAPADVVLPGITRKHVLKFCKKNNVRVKEMLLTPKEASAMTACFISGTSPMVLPVQRLDETEYNVDNVLMRSIMEGWGQV